MNINEVNNLDENVFFEIFKNIFEHSDFITKLVQKKRPFKKKSELMNHFLNIFDSLDKDTKVNNNLYRLSQLIDHYCGNQDDHDSEWG